MYYDIGSYGINVNHSHILSIIVNVFTYRTSYYKYHIAQDYSTDSTYVAIYIVLLIEYLRSLSSYSSIGDLQVTIFVYLYKICAFYTHTVLALG